MRTYLRAVAYIDADTAGRSVFSTGFAVLEPQPGLEPKYFSYACRSDLVIGDVVARSVGVSYPAIAPTELGLIEVPVQPIDQQRHVADFLDQHVAQIDRSIRLRTEQIEALEHRAGCAMDFCLVQRGWNEPKTLEAEALYPLPDGWRAARLSQVLLQLTNGYVGPTREILVDEGVPYIQSMHIKGGEIDFNRRHFFVTPEWHADRPRINLRAGDVLVVQTGDIGKVAVVPPDFGEASCHALQILRVRPEIVSGEYLGAYLGSSFGFHSLLSRATGALHPHLEGGIRSVPVVLPPLDVQAGIVREVTEIRRSIRRAQAAMREQITLLEERKRSTITAAVAGEFDVSAASGRGAVA